MPVTPVPLWKESPFLRLIVPFIAGIVVQWYCHLSPSISWAALGCSLALLLFFQYTRTYFQFRFYWLYGLFLNCCLFFTGALLTNYRNINQDRSWVLSHYREGAVVIAAIDEPLSEKDNSFKAVCVVQSLIENRRLTSVKGSILVYFQKDNPGLLPSYGSRILFKKNLDRIKNSGNPGAFDYERYYGFQDIYQQVFLKPGEYKILSGKKENAIQNFLYLVRDRTIGIFRRYLHGAKETGLAEALLIGYKDDLDRNLVRSYSNTGVVHIIAISGMQLALIYGFLLLLFKPFARFRLLTWLKPVIVITALWMFTFLSGASPSVLRAAVMFTCIVAGECFSKRVSIYNNLAASALLLLCYNPFWLWDTGFQLSYTAVLSIVIFMKPIYHAIFIKNKSLDFLWQLCAVSLSAQVLTTPISIFYFHQFPNYFLLTNLVAVPVSSIILFGELILLAISFLPLLASPTGTLLSSLISFMNGSIEHLEKMPFSRWEHLQVSLLQTVLLYAMIGGFSLWLMQKNKSALKIGLLTLLLFATARSYSFHEMAQDRKLMIYNIPKHQAIDFTENRKCLFKGDSVLEAPGFMKDLYLGPPRILNRLSESCCLPSLLHGNVVFQFGSKRILLIEQPVAFLRPAVKIRVELIILSQNPNLTIRDISKVFDCDQMVFDASISTSRSEKWKQECEQLHISCFDVVDKGAFVMKVD